MLIVGETREWELVEYAQDAISAGKKKGADSVGPRGFGAGGNEVLRGVAAAVYSRGSGRVYCRRGTFWNPRLALRR